MMNVAKVQNSDLQIANFSNFANVFAKSLPILLEKKNNKGLIH